jgi:uncharacterized integral membrane protein
MQQWPTLEEQIEAAGIHYPRSYDIAYRTGYIIQSLGAAAFFILYFLKSEYYIIPLIIFEAGIALSSLFLLVWKREIKRFILFMTFSGVAIQFLSIFLLPEYRTNIFCLGLGFILAGGAGLVGKEAYCFGFIEGWLLLLIYPVTIIPNIMGLSSHNFNLILSGIIAFLQVSFLRKKLSQPLLKSCEGNVCGLPEEKR